MAAKIAALQRQRLRSSTQLPRTRSTILRRQPATPAGKSEEDAHANQRVVQPSEIIRDKNRREVSCHSGARRNRESMDAKKSARPCDRLSLHRHRPRRDFATLQFVKYSQKQIGRPAGNQSK